MTGIGFLIDVRKEYAMNAIHPTYKGFAKRLREAREARKLSQTELGKKLGMPPSQISHFEAGKRRPSLDNIKRLLAVLNVSADYLLERTDLMFPNPKTMGELESRYSELSWDNQDLVDDFIDLLHKKEQEPDMAKSFADRATYPDFSTLNDTTTKARDD